MKMIKVVIRVLVCLSLMISFVVPASTTKAMSILMPTVNVIGALWEGDPFIDAEIPEVWRADFDFLILTDNSSMEFLDKAGTEFILRAQGYTDVSAHVGGGFSTKEDKHLGYNLTVTNKDSLVQGVHYQLIPPRNSELYKWIVNAGVYVTKSGNGSTTPLPNGPLQYGSDIDPNYNSMGVALFSDVDNQNWAYNAIKDLTTRKVLTGYPDGKFRPDKIVTRAEFAKIMVLAAGLTPTKVTSTSFTDIKPTDWYTPFIESAKEYLSGYSLSNGKIIYDPEAPALREDIAVAIVKLKGYNKTRLADRSIIQAMFKDYNGISDYAKDYVALAVENSLVSGFPDETFKAQQPVTRAQAAAMLWRAYQYGNDNKDEQPVKIEVPAAPSTVTGAVYQ
jgi:hypothetical protein